MKVAACFSTNSIDCQAAARAMAEAMRFSDRQHCEVFPVDNGAMACVTTFDSATAVPLLRRSLGGNILMVAGVPLDLQGSLDKRLERVVAVNYRQASDHLKGLDGAFVALFWDAAAGKLLVVSDALGIQPLYFLQREGLILLGSEVKAFPATGLVEVTMDPAGWGAFFSLDFNIAQRTQLAEVQRFEAGRCLTYDPSSDTMDCDTYWSWPSPRPNLKSSDVDTGELVEILQQEMQSYTQHCSRGTLLLSGGFDSRLLLSLLYRSKMEFETLILMHQEETFGADGKLAVRVSKLLNQMDFDVIISSPQFYSSPDYLRYIAMSDAAFPTLRLFIARVWRYLRPGMGAIWEGLGPGFGFSSPYPRPGGFDVYLEDRCKSGDCLLWQAVRSTFARKLADEMYGEFHEVLQEELDKYSDDEFGVAHFQVNNQMRCRMAVNPTKVYTNIVAPFTPGLSKAYWDGVGSIPHHITAGGKLYLDLLLQHFPEAVRVPICSGGKFYTHKAFTPVLWTTKALARARQRFCYYYGRLRRLGGSEQSRTSGMNPLVSQVLKTIEADHPDLNAEAVHALARSKPPYDWHQVLARNILFYWQTWRWTMEGRLSTRNTVSFLEHEESYDKQ
jgi:hypothetical protein